jgi:RimJ/RimL family protein N-acetyltransferase
MALTFRPTNYQSLNDALLLAKWLSDPAIRYLAQPQKDEESLRNPETAELILERNQPSNAHRAPIDLILELDGEPVGHADVLFDPPHRLTREGKVAWLSILIGEKKHHRRGFGREAMLHLEKLAKKAGANCAEVGVFEFNEPSLRLMRSLGYEEIGKLADFTWWNGRRWADIRLAKSL